MGVTRDRERRKIRNKKKRKEHTLLSLYAVEYDAGGQREGNTEEE